MRAELRKANMHVVFVWGFASGIAGDDVKIYTYEGMSKSTGETFGVSFSRIYWDVLLSRGYHIVPSKVLRDTVVDDIAWRCRRSTVEISDELKKVPDAQANK